jgi:anti-sigma B factor antagonist
MDINQGIDRFFAKNRVMRVEANEDSHSLVIRLAGALDLESSAALQNLLLWIIEQQPVAQCLIVDLEHVNYISSTGVGALTIALTHAVKQGRRLILFKLQPKVRAVFQLLGLMDFFEEAGPDG